MSVIWAISPSRIRAPAGCASSGSGNAAFSASSDSSLIAREGLQVQAVVDDQSDRSDKPSISRVRAARDRFEDRLHVPRRAGDHLQDLGRRGLPLERLLRLVEQPHVLDREHRLVGEGLEAGSTCLSGRARHRTGDRDGADRPGRRSAAASPGCCGSPTRRCRGPTAVRTRILQRRPESSTTLRVRIARVVPVSRLSGVGSGRGPAPHRLASLLRTDPVPRGARACRRRSPRSAEVASHSLSAQRRSCRRPAARRSATG